MIDFPASGTSPIELDYGVALLAVFAGMAALTAVFWGYFRFRGEGKVPAPPE